MDLLVQYII